MRGTVGTLRTCALAVALPLSAVAQTQPERNGSAAAYCDFVEGTADAESALLVAPQLFGSAGLTNAGDATGSGIAPIGSPAPRLTAGLAWNADRFVRGQTLQAKAQAECRRQHALAGLQTALVLGPDLGEADAAEARARVLREHLGRLETRLGLLRAEVKSGEATIEEQRSFELRLDLVRESLRLAEGAQKRLEGMPPAPTTPLPSLVARVREADGEVERELATLRTTAAWELGVRGGYDQLWGSNAVPVFALVTFSWNTGRLGQGSANDRARDGRDRWMKEDVSGALERSTQLLRELEALRGSTAARLGEVTTLEADLRGQLEELRTMDVKAVRKFRDLLEFEHARIAAEKAYLERRTKGLSEFLGAAK